MLNILREFVGYINKVPVEDVKGLGGFVQKLKQGSSSSNLAEMGNFLNEIIGNSVVRDDVVWADLYFQYPDRPMGYGNTESERMWFAVRSRDQKFIDDTYDKIFSQSFHEISHCYMPSMLQHLISEGSCPEIASDGSCEVLLPTGTF